ncbi:helix-turn-helix transcriptional regulator [Reichenbachiella agarivorans]|uniref:Helix-turn-helix transcriptional regulator n=1 Tax=Reichenbachiella agarivorans TaxID=2979464 RepID=A0ABY6CSD6_9BACT|nr:helix-turn-helix transcriptional regulator [Reichenbachiella agarivorans]UXP32920.1 helix-turn-helix transcriptional regulator [Reichenbachiella agarivorans]
MKNSTLLTNLFNSYGHYLAPRSAGIKKLDFDKILATVFSPGPFYHYILDSPTLTFESASESTKQMMGICIVDQPLEVLINLIHPDDFGYMLKCEEYVANFLTTQVTPDKVTHYKISYCLREKVKDGSYRLFMMQNLAVQTTDTGSLLKVLGIHTDISHITNTNNYKLSLTGLNGEPSYLGIDIMNEANVSEFNSNPFTKREIEVIKLLTQGYTAKEMSDMLNISKETIISHKKNAMSKSSSKNSNQLIAYCISRGLI